MCYLLKKKSLLSEKNAQKKNKLAVLKHKKVGWSSAKRNRGKGIQNRERGQTHRGGGEGSWKIKVGFHPALTQGEKKENPQTTSDLEKRNFPSTSGERRTGVKSLFKSRLLRRGKYELASKTGQRIGSVTH